MKEMYVALSGAVSREKQFAMVANNLANVNTVGFKREEAIFRVRPPEVDFQKMQKSHRREMALPEPRQWIEGNRNYAAVQQSFMDFSEGSLKATGHILDVALESRDPGATGVPFFVVATPEGNRLTRAGNFHLNALNELCDASNHLVLGANGLPIQFAGQPQEPFTITEEGNIFSDGNLQGRLQVVMVDEPNDLDHLGYNYFGDRNGEVATRPVAQADNVSVRHRFLEMANTNAVSELVKMIDLQRSYSAFQKSIQSMSDASSEVIDYVMQ